MRIVAIVQGEGSEHRAESPRFNSRTEAEKQLQAIRDAMQTREGTVVSLDWLTARSENIISAHIEEAR